jgi:hypothetical protein
MGGKLLLLAVQLQLDAKKRQMKAPNRSSGQAEKNNTVDSPLVVVLQP